MMDPHWTSCDDAIRLYQGDWVDVLERLPEKSVHCVVTSPPYWGLRDYGVGGQLGLETTPEEYVEKMVEGFRRGVWRVLRDDGTLWLNLGDTYASSNSGNARSFDPLSPGRVREVGQPHRSAASGLKPKDMVGIPWRVALALQADGWYLRSDIIWAKPSPMPSSVTDRPTTAHEYLFLLTKQPRYFYDAEAIKEPCTGTAHSRGTGVNPKARIPSGWNTGPGDHRELKGRFRHKQNESFSGAVCSLVSKRNKRSVWTVSSTPFKEAHFATFPPKLITPCVLAGTSGKGCCPECGAPWERVTETSREFVSGSGRSGNPIIGTHPEGCQGGGETGDIRRGPVLTTRTTGWSPTCECGREDVVPSTVLDPFSGAGTTMVVSAQQKRRGIGVELKADYLKMSASRIGRETANRLDL